VQPCNRATQSFLLARGCWFPLFGHYGISGQRIVRVLLVRSRGMGKGRRSNVRSNTHTHEGNTLLIRVFFKRRIHKEKRPDCAFFSSETVEPVSRLICQTEIASDRSILKVAEKISKGSRQSQASTASTRSRKAPAKKYVSRFTAISDLIANTFGTHRQASIS
jgi:hypothetical protein